MRKGSWIILILAVAFVGFVFYSLTHVEPVEIIQSRLERVDGRVFVTGELKNTSSHRRAVDLEVHYFDKTGRPLGQNTLKFAALPARGVESFKSPPVAIAGVADFSLYLNHGRDPYGN